MLNSAIVFFVQQSFERVGKPVIRNLGAAYFGILAFVGIINLFFIF